MLRNLQLYTICIVVLVIVLSQFSLISDYFSFESKPSNALQDKSKTVSQEDDSFFDNIKNTKYGEPFREITGMINEINNTTESLEDNLDTLSSVLDLEKNIDDMYDLLDDM